MKYDFLPTKLEKKNHRPRFRSTVTERLPTKDVPVSATGGQ